MRLLSLLLTSAFIAVSIDASAATLSGRVKKVGASDPKDEGVPGTTVTVYGPDMKIVGKPTSTGTDGRYRFDDLPAMATSIVVFDKQGFRFKPTEKTDIAITDNTTLDVELIENGGTLVYYQRVVDQIRKADPAAKEHYLSLVKALDYKARQTVDSLRDALRNLNGISVMDEYPIPGVTVALLDCSPCPSTCSCISTPAEVTVTDIKGSYKFSRVPTGTYVVRGELEGAFDSVKPLEVAEGTVPVAPEIPMRIATVSEAIAVTDSGPFDLSGADPKQPVVFLPRGCQSVCAIQPTVARTDATGTLSRSLPEGRYTIVLPGIHSPSTVHNIEIAANRATTIDVTRPPD